MKCGPDGCPIIAYTSLPSEQRKAQRKELAIQLMEQGFTEHQIAEQFGVSQQQISKDLKGLQPSSKPLRPKGGRPRAKQKCVDDEMPTEEEAEEDYQQTIYDQACSMVEDMTDPTRRKFFAHLRRKYDGEICK